MDNNNSFNNSNNSSDNNGDYSAPELLRNYYDEPKKEAPRMKFDPETGRPLTQEANPFQENSYQQNSYQQTFQRQSQNDPYLRDMYGQNNFDQHCQNEFQRNRNANMYAQAQRGNNNGFAIASLVCGILSIVSCFTCCGPVILGPLAIIFGVLDLNARKAKMDNNKGMSTAGIICAIVAIVLTIGFYAFVMIEEERSVDNFFEEFEEEFDDFDDGFYYDDNFDINEL